MNKREKLNGKFQIAYLPKNNGAEICEVEKIDKFTEIKESSEGRFSVKFQIEDTKESAIDFIYQLKLYISKDDAKEIFNDFVNY